MDADTDNPKEVMHNNWVDDGDNDDGSNTKILVAEEEKMKELKLQLIDRREDVQVTRHKRDSISTKTLDKHYELKYFLLHGVPLQN